MMTNSRRKFLKGSLTTMAPRSLWSTEAEQSAPRGATGEGSRQEPMRVSVSSYSFRGLMQEGKIDIFGFMETCKYRYHLDATDLWSGFIPNTEDAYLKKLKEGLDERELIVPNIAVDGAQVWEDAPEKRQQCYERALTFLNAGRILGARFVRVDAGGGRQAREWTNEQFDHIVKRYKEYAQYAYDHGFKAGAESHWGPEAYWPSMQQLYKAVNHPGFTICCHIGGWQGTPEEKDAADRESAPRVAHTHIALNIPEGSLVEKMTNLRNANCQGYYNVEHHSGRDEYAEVGIQIAKVRSVLQSWRSGGTGAPSPSSPQ